jgi:hypothetical protein
MKLTLTAPLILLLIILTACTAAPTASGPGASEVGTIVAATMAALTQDAPPAGAFRFENVSLVIPPSLGTGATGQRTDRIEYPPCINPSCVDPATTMAQHILITLSGYPHTGEPRLVIFKTAEYTAMGEFTANEISDLQALARTGSLPDNPSGPYFEVRRERLTFQNGQGIGSFTQISNGIVPINNAALFYSFEGLTADGQYYVFAVLPVAEPFLAADDNPSTAFPEGAIPFGWENPAEFDVPAYLGAVAGQFGTAAPATFTPDLDQIKALIASLRIDP